MSEPQASLNPASGAGATAAALRTSAQTPCYPWCVHRDHGLPVTSCRAPCFQGFNSMLTMKKSALMLAASVAALSALVLTSASLEAATSFFAAAGVLAIAFRDYSRSSRTLLTAHAFTAATPNRSERLGLAA